MALLQNFSSKVWHLSIFEYLKNEIKPIKQLKVRFLKDQNTDLDVNLIIPSKWIILYPGLKYEQFLDDLPHFLWNLFVGYLTYREVVCKYSYTSLLLR